MEERCSEDEHPVSHAWRDAFEAVPMAIVAVDASARVVYATDAARAFLAAARGLSIDHDGMLGGESAAATTHLRRHLARAAGDSMVQGHLEVARRIGRPLLLTLAPLPRGGPAALLVIIVDPDDTPLPSDETLRTLYSLTPSEARVALRLGTGLCVNEIGVDLGVTVHSVRLHLKRAMAKTGTNTQARLVRLLLALGSGCRNGA